MDWPLLTSLEEQERREFLALGRRRSFGRNEIVCHAGDPADSVHLVTSGRLAVHVSLASGDAAMVNVLAPGGYFGELALLRAEAHRTATIRALEPSETISISATAFHKLCRDRPGVERVVSVLLADRVDELSQHLLEVMYVGFDRRLNRRLLELSSTYANGAGSGAGPIVIPFTQTQLAELTGGTRPTVNQALQRLSEQGIVSLARGRVEVLDVDRLRSKCGF